MKKTLLTAAVIIASYSTYAQNTFPASGNVGIGTMSPQTNLHVFANISPVIAIQDNSSLLRILPSNGINYIESGTSLSSSSADIRFTPMNATANWMTIQGSTGNVGIGTTNPNVPLHIARSGNNVTGNLTLVTTFTDPTGIKGISLGYNQASQAGIIYSENNTGIGSPLEFWTYNGSSFAPRMIFTQAGNLGIGTPTPDQLLSVAGTIHSKEVKVDLTGWPDYVFKSKYRLLPLNEVKAYIDQNNHLPDMPSGEKIEKDGLNLGEINKLLVKKVEELTLYLIEKDKELKGQNERLKKLEQKISELNR
jgi:hypothetical protein